jgi:molecular chaperone HscB
MIDFSRNYFDLFGLPLAFRVDAAKLDHAYRQLQSDVHPDRFAGGSDAEKRVALQSSARVNEAYGALKNPVQRAQYLLRLHDVDAISETDTALPLAFLERQLERREQAADAQAGGDTRTLTALLTDARAESAELERTLAHRLDVEHAYAAARMQVRELTFLAKLADDIDAMLAAVDA